MSAAGYPKKLAGGVITSGAPGILFSPFMTGFLILVTYWLTLSLWLPRLLMH